MDLQSKWTQEGADGSPVGDYFCSLPLVKVLGIHHPLFIAHKLKWSFLETLLCQLSWTLLRRFAKAIRISASMVCTNEPFHLLERPRKPFRDWGLVVGPVVFLGVFPQSKPVAVSRATVTKLPTAVFLASLNISFGLKIVFPKKRWSPVASRRECHTDLQLEQFQGHSRGTFSPCHGRVLPGSLHISYRVTFSMVFPDSVPKRKLPGSQ